MEKTKKRPLPKGQRAWLKVLAWLFIFFTITSCCATYTAISKESSLWGFITPERIEDFAWWWYPASIAVNILLAVWAFKRGSRFRGMSHDEWLDAQGLSLDDK